jgi:protein-S-isoprenylcysteine O-methyltransferase Ste14
MLTQTQKASLWTASGFYALIALEFIYMATPFAAFFYSVYSPILNFMNSYISLSWLNNTFLPHIVKDTSSLLLNASRGVGIAFALIGFLGFFIGVIQIYYSKLFRKTVVINGLYRFVRHPQYAFLIVWGLGLVILWPRTIVLLSFISMLFIYFFLAKIEESECEKKFGPIYFYYKENTAMFFPFCIPTKFSILKLPESKIKRFIAILIFYFVAMVIAIGISGILRNWSLNSLYAKYEKNRAYVSVTRMNMDSLEHIIQIALASPDVQQRLKATGGEDHIKYINYIMPNDMFILEIPMNKVAESAMLHFVPRAQPTRISKIVFMQAETRNGEDINGKALISQIRIDPSCDKVLEIKSPPFPAELADIAMPLF